MSNIIILNGSPRKNGNTARLIKSFTEGAESAGNKVTEFYLPGMNIHGCVGCLGANKNSESPCVQKDDMEKIYTVFSKADVVVFASPIYFWTVTGQLKTAADRLYAELECLGYGDFAKKSILLMTAGGNGFDQAVTWYHTYERNLGWKNMGEILGSGKERAAYDLGKSI